MLGFSLDGVWLATSLLFGLWPALHTSRADVQLALKSGDRGSSDSPAARRSRDLLIITEVALTLVLLTAAGLVLKSFANARPFRSASNPVVLPPRALICRSDLSRCEKDSSVHRRSCRKNQNHSRCDALCSRVKSSAHDWMANWFLCGRNAGTAARPKPRSGDDGCESQLFANDRRVLVRGRMFDAHDQFESEQVAIVDQLLVDRYYAGQNPIGKRLKMNVNMKHGRGWRTIVGVVPHLKGMDSKRKFLCRRSSCRSRNLRKTISSSCCAVRFPRNHSSSHCATPLPHSIRRSRFLNFAPWKSASKKPGPRRACSLLCLRFLPRSRASSRSSGFTALSLIMDCAAHGKLVCVSPWARGVSRLLRSFSARFFACS